MLTRLLTVVIATAIVLLPGCKTITPEGFLPPDKRDKTVFQCGSDCYVPVDPSKPQWVYEYIRVNRGGVFHLWLPSGWQYVEPRISFKDAAAASVLTCPSYAPAHVICNVDNKADPTIKYGYTIHVKDMVTGVTSSYDPFVWPQ